MKRTICPRCGSSNIDWIIPQVWSKWECKDCSYTGPAIEADDDLIAEIKADWEDNKEKYLEEENMRAQQIASGEDEILVISDLLSPGHFPQTVNILGSFVLIHLNIYFVIV